MVIIDAQPLANTSTSQLGHVCAQISRLAVAQTSFASGSFALRHMDARPAATWLASGLHGKGGLESNRFRCRKACRESADSTQ